MSDLISRQAAIRAFAEYEKRTTPSWSGAYKETLEEWIDELTETLSDVPTIDIVHCKECKFWSKNAKDWVQVYEPCCHFEPYDFCSYGERME